jgi:arylformamidase
MPEISEGDRRRWLDAEYSPSRTARDAVGSMQAGRVKASEAREHFNAHGVYLNLSYGLKPANRIELFGSGEPALPAFVMFHGGWWQEGTIDDGARYARAVSDLGANHVAVGYSLAPEATLSEIVDEAASAVRYVVDHATELRCDPNRIFVGGHSAGAHLAAALVTDIVPANVRESVAGLLLIGGAFDLRPISESYVNDVVRMTTSDAQRLSPLYLPPARNVPVTLRVGELEPSEFHRQSAELADRWSGATQMNLAVVPGRDHFDVLNELDSPGGSLQRDLADLLAAARS